LYAEFTELDDHPTPTRSRRISGVLSSFFRRRSMHVHMSPEQVHKGVAAVAAVSIMACLLLLVTRQQQHFARGLNAAVLT
jgi:hypothetical protein